MNKNFFVLCFFVTSFLNRLSASPLLFEDRSLFKMSLSFNFSEYRRNAMSLKYDKYAIDANGPYGLPAEISLAEEQGRTIKINGLIYSGGRNRNAYCDIPPLWIVFDKNQDLSQGPFAGVKKVKLYTECKYQNDKSEDSHEVFREKIFREYSYYQDYQRKTELSYKTRLSLFSILDISMQESHANFLGFFIEPRSMFESRIERMANQSPRVANSNKVKHIDPDDFVVNGHMVAPCIKGGMNFDKKQHEKVMSFHLSIKNHDIGFNIGEDSRCPFGHILVSGSNVDAYTMTSSSSYKMFTVPYDFDRAKDTIDLENRSKVKITYRAAIKSH